MALKAPGRSKEFTITLIYGLSRISPADYFAKVLVERTPGRSSAPFLPRSDRRSVRAGCSSA